MLQFIRKNRKLAVVVIFLIILAFSARRVLAGDETRVLVLHSSHYGHLQTDSLQKGIDETLRDSPFPVTIFVEYLDSLRFSPGADREEPNIHLYKKYSSLPLEGIIVHGDEALRFFQREFQPVFHHIPVFYVNVNNPDPGNHPPELFSGVTRHLPLDALLQTALTLQPELETIYFFAPALRSPGQEKLIDTLLSSKIIEENGLVVQFQENLILEDIQNISETLDTTSLIMIPFGASARQGGMYTQPYIQNTLSQISGAPIYDLSMALLGQGIVGGPLIDDHYEGQRAAQALLDFWQGGSLPVATNNEAFYAFDEHYFGEYGFSRTAVPEDSLFINSREPALNIDPFLIIGLLGLFIILLLAIAALLKNHRKNREIALLHYRTGQDSLTRLNNRITLDNDLSTYNRLLSFGDISALSMAFIDLDNFREINDRYGHVAGDQVLQSFASHLKRTHVPGLEKVYRFAGDEFILLLKDTNELDMEILLTTLMELFNTPIALDTGQTITVQGSVGIATMPGDTDDVTQLIALADEAMYAAKQTGKNKITLYRNLEK